MVATKPDIVSRLTAGDDMEWELIASAPEDVVVRTKIDDEWGVRNDQTLLRSGRLWFHPDRSMYVYYTPTHWTLPAPPKGD